MNLFHLLAQTATRLPDQPAVFEGDRLVWTYGDLRDRVLKLAAGLRRAHAPGDRIAIFSENAPAYVELLFAIWAAEMAAVPINAKLHAREAAEILADSGASLVFVSPKLAKGLAEAASAAVRAIEIGTASYEVNFAEPWAGPVRSDPDALAWLFYTSGTTGRSKGAMLSHRNMVAMTVAHLADMERIDRDSSIIHAAPMSHGSGTYIPAYVARGARQVIPASRSFEPAETLALCNAHPSCGMFLAPTMVQRLRMEAERTGTRPRNLRSIVYGGGPMYLEELKRARAVLGPVLCQIYGQGEAPMTITGLTLEDHEAADDAVLASVGHARTGVEVMVASEEGAPVPVGEIGEVMVKGDVVMMGYWNNPSATAETIRDGWLRTGDMGSLDARGYLALRDRSKDVVISGGSNVYPREVEEALLRHPAVEEVSVVGTPDPEWGEIVVAFVVARQGHAPDHAMLDAHCISQIARFKKPKRYVFTDALPKNNYGKVLKRDLRERLKREAQASNA